MVTNASDEDLQEIARQEHKPSPVPVILKRAEEATRVLVSGSAVGAMRRILLYLCVMGALLIVTVMANTWWALVPSLLGSAAIGLLMGSDDLR